MSRAAPAGDSPPDCPSEERLVELAEGRLADRDDQAAALHLHLDGCEECRLLVGELLRDHRLDGLQGGTLDRYLLLDELGRGGMGVVYAAFDPELDRKVALKLVRPGSGDPARAAARLLAEAQALAKLSHPNVVTVYEARALGGRVFLAMELVPGRSLREWLHSPRPAAEIVHRFLEAADGLCAAHDAGLVHADFKPENALLGDDGRVRVTDFGLAREAGSAADAFPWATSRAVPRASVSPAVEGTPAYLSPEQWRGQPADARSDQFAWCVALWEALSGVRPFAASGRAALLLEMEHGPLRRPGAARLPARVRKLLLRGLSCEPDRRHPTLRALCDELRRDRLGGLRGPLFAATAALLLAAGLAVGSRGLPTPARLHGGTGAAAAREGGGTDAPAALAPHPRVPMQAAALGEAALPEALPLALREAEAALQQVAIVRFNLARALRAEGKQPRRARELAELSRAFFQRRAAAHARELREIEQWLGGGVAQARPRRVPHPAERQPLLGGVPGQRTEEAPASGARTLR